MKNAPRDFEISRQDFDSFFLWKVFWKLIKRENPFLFFLKVFLLGAAFVAFVLFIILVGELAGA